MSRLFLLSVGILTLSACGSKQNTPYTEEDFLLVPKLDAHVHANVDSQIFVDVAEANNFEILSINVDYPDFPDIDTQAAISKKLKTTAHEHFHFAGTFSMSGFGTNTWEQYLTSRIDNAVDDGAVAIKVWKNVGMVEEDTDGSKVFLNDARMEPLASILKRKSIPLIAHQGEPKNCWLPLDMMTTNNDKLYFSAHPEYYMYLHPEEPRYEELMTARDEFVRNHSDLKVVGAHLASLEWSVDRIGAFLDDHPNATVDLAARMSEIQNQSNQDYDKVRKFFINYQDRILYGSDLTHNPQTEEMRQQNPPQADNFAKQANAVWRADWLYLATDQSQFVGALQADSIGLNLPRSVIDKVYYKNAHRVFNLDGK